MPSIEILSSLICDEVRQEANGRAIIIGAAPIGPALSGDEETIIPRLHFYVEGLVNNVSSIKFRLISKDNRSTPLEITMDMEDIGDDEAAGEDGVATVAAFVFGRERIKFSGAGVYKLQYSLEPDEWRDVREFFFPARE